MHNRNTTSTGFTIVELLIVVVVIAILATISIVAYTNIRDRATTSAVKSDLANFAKKMDIIRIESGNELYPQRNYLVQSMGLRATKSAYATNRSNWVYCPAPDRTNYALGVMDSSGKGYFLTPNGIQEGVVYGGSNTCDAIGAPSGSSTDYQLGYIWNTTTGTGAWADWVN